MYKEFKMKIDWFLLIILAGSALLFYAIPNSDSISLTASFDSHHPGCQVLKLEAPYSNDSEEAVIAKMDTIVHNWLQEHSSYTLIGKIDSMKSVSSDGELNVFYLVKGNSFI